MNIAPIVLLTPTEEQIFSEPIRFDQPAEAETQNQNSPEQLILQREKWEREREAAIKELLEEKSAVMIRAEARLDEIKQQLKALGYKAPRERKPKKAV